MYPTLNVCVTFSFRVAVSMLPGVTQLLWRDKKKIVKRLRIYVKDQQPPSSHALGQEIYE